MQGSVLVRVTINYGHRPKRWFEAVQKQFTRNLTAVQKVRFASRLGARSLALHPKKSG
jgi:hypothetical protein